MRLHFFFFSYHFYHSTRYLASIFNIQMQANFLKPKLIAVLKFYNIQKFDYAKKCDHLELGISNVYCK